MTQEPQSLDELFGSAIQQIKQAAAKKLANKHKPVRVETADEKRLTPKELYSNEANWQPARGIAVVHKETKTLIGNFQEYIHLTETDTRKLIRTEALIRVDCIEEVDSDLFWTPPAIEHSQRRAECFITCALELEAPSVAATRAYVKVVALSEAFDAICEVRLADACIFARMDQIFHLPSGVNVLPVLTHQSKIAIKAAIEKVQHADN